MPMTQYSYSRSFVYQKAPSNKFWKIWIEGFKVVTHWGRIGTAGSYQIKDFSPSFKNAVAYADKQAYEKLRKGYVETSSPAERVTSIGVGNVQPEVDVKQPANDSNEKQKRNFLM